MLFGAAAPLYLRDGDAIPDGVDPERITIVVRTCVHPPQREDEDYAGSCANGREQAPGAASARISGMGRRVMIVSSENCLTRSAETAETRR